MSEGSIRARYFAGDVAATTAACSLIAPVTAAAVPSSWPPWAAMPFGMALGMLLSVPCWLLVSRFLGMLEPMLQIMLGGMVAGMAATHWPGSEPLSSAALGAACGTGTSLAVGAMDWMLRRGGASE